MLFTVLRSVNMADYCTKSTARGQQNTDKHQYGPLCQFQHKLSFGLRIHGNHKRRSSYDGLPYAASNEENVLLKMKKS